VVVLVGIVMFLKAPGAEAKVAAEVAGSAAFASRHELRPLLRGEEPGGVRLGLLGRTVVALPADRATHHTLVLGPSGVGKTEAIFKPNAAYGVGSMVVTDPKGELWAATGGLHAGALRYAPTDPAPDPGGGPFTGFNWIPLCAEARMADLLAAAAVQLERRGWGDGRYYAQCERDLCAALFAHAAALPEGQRTPESVARLTSLGPQAVHKALLESPSVVARSKYASFEALRPGERADYLRGLMNYLDFLLDDTVRAFCCRGDIPDFTALDRAPAVLYWCLPEQDTARLQSLSAIFFTTLLDQLSRAPDRSRPVLFLLDEFANLGALPTFPTTISVARGRGLAMVLGVQALSQLSALYGQDGRETIVNTCATKVIMHGLDGDSAAWAERLLGTATVTTPAPKAGQDPHLRARALLTADEIRRLPTDELLMVHGNLRPARLRKAWFTPHHRARGPAPQRAWPAGPESPIERALAAAMDRQGLAYTCQHVVAWRRGGWGYVPKYRVDFALRAADGGRRLAVECDGKAWHAGWRAARDRVRQAEIERLGWTVLRFTGRQIHRNPDACARAVARALRRLEAGKKAA
jgi:type IV secretion system protein VirD4